MNLSTSLICCDLSNIKQDIDTLLDNGLNWLHADFMDGHFVPRYGISPELIQWIRKRYGSRVVIDSHMMVDDPYSYADVIARYSDWYFFHYEATKDPFRTIQMLKKKYHHLRIGLAFNLLTPISFIDSLSNILCVDYGKYVEGIMFMGISPGVLGTDSLPDIVQEKLNYMSIKFPFYKTFVDGSVNFETIGKYRNLGAYTVVCGGSTILKDVSMGETRANEITCNINKLKNLTAWSEKQS